MNILSVCFQASPDKGSEAGVGWGWTRVMAADHKVWVITNDANREAVEQAAAADAALDNVQFHFVPWNTRGVGRPGWPFIRPFRYAAWRREALRVALELCAEEPIDLCHYVNAVGFRDVVPLWQTGRPFVWGPVGGLTFVHRALYPYLGRRARLFYRLKNVLRRLSIRFSALPRQASAQATTIIAATSHTRDGIRAAWGKHSVVVPEVGMRIPAGARPAPGRSTDEPLRIAWSGRVHSGKAPLLAIDAVTGLAPSVNWALTLVGDGPDRQRLERTAAERGLAENINITGWLARDDAMHTVAGAHVFLLTSVYDLTSNVFVEALAAGVPVVCLSCQAAAEYVGEDCGIVVDVDKTPDIVAGLGAALTRLFDDEPARQQMAANALRVARRFDWELKRELLREVYRESVGRR